MESQSGQLEPIIYHAVCSILRKVRPNVTKVINNDTLYHATTPSGPRLAVHDFDFSKF